MLSSFFKKGFSEKDIEKCTDNQLKKEYLENNYKSFIIEYSNSINYRLINELRSIYNNGYEFPEWIYSMLIQNPSYLNGAEVFFPKNSDISLIRKLTVEREPVNISGKRYYNQNKMLTTFGWKVGYYQTYWNEHKVIPPNISIYCKTPVLKKMGNTIKNFGDAHILNVIGLSFDEIHRPDYVFASKIQKTEHFILDYYDYLFEMIYDVAKRKGFKNVVMSMFGANNFALKFRGGPTTFQSKIWFPLLIKHLQKNRNSVKTYSMGMKKLSEQYHFINSAMKWNGIFDVGFFPNLMEHIDLNNTLIINAWDPFSFVGNGNNNDNSLDGFIGRYTACSLLCWPKFNKKIIFTELNHELKIPQSDLSNKKKEIDEWIINNPMNFVYQLDQIISKSPVNEQQKLRKYAAKKLIQINLHKPIDIHSKPDEILESMSQFAGDDFYRKLDKSTLDFMVKELIKNGADINQQFEHAQTALAIAVWNGDNYNFIETLIKNGANLHVTIDTYETLKTYRIEGDASLLIGAIVNRDLDVLKLLVENNLLVKERDERFAQNLFDETKDPKLIPILKYLEPRVKRWKLII